MAKLTPIETTQQQTPVEAAQQALERANTNRHRNVYLARDPDRVRAEAAALRAGSRRPPLFGIPVAVKDCFDVAGYPTTCGSRFYAAERGIAATHSYIAERLIAAGAMITGKTHLHQLAYGITGENSEYGNCLQPRDASLLTGGSSSGSAAAVQEGSAIAAIGTDTGGSVRVPAALCGLSGYRSTLQLGGEDTWRGGVHLASSFDTLGWLFRDLRDGPVLAAALLDVAPVDLPHQVAIAAVDESFLHDCEPAVLTMYRSSLALLRGLPADVDNWVPDFWDDSREIFAPIQGHEAAALHQGNFHHFEKPIADRLAWGAQFSQPVIDGLRVRHRAFRVRMDALLTQYDFLVLPCAPMTALPAAADHAETRATILRYTTPASLAGTPVVAWSSTGGGVQLIAARGADSKLLAFAASIGRKIALG